MASRIGLAIAIIFLGALGVPHAQEIIAPAGPTAPPVIPQSAWRPVWDALITGLAGMLAICIPLLTAVLMQWLRAKTGVSEAEQQRILGPKLEEVFNRARAWADERLSKPGTTLAGANADRDRVDRARLMVTYVKEQNPDLVRALRADDGQLYRGAVARLAAASSVPATSPVSLPIAGAFR